MKRESSRESVKEFIRDELNEPDETVKGLGLRKPESTMRKLRDDKGGRVIPWGDYCYDSKGSCPYWDMAENKEGVDNGFCWFIGKGDWWEDESCGLLWDQIKMCGKNMDVPLGKLPLYEEEEYGSI